MGTAHCPSNGNKDNKDGMDSVEVSCKRFELTMDMLQLIEIPAPPGITLQKNHVSSNDTLLWPCLIVPDPAVLEIIDEKYNIFGESKMHKELGRRRAILDLLEHLTSEPQEDAANAADRYFDPLAVLLGPDCLVTHNQRSYHRPTLPLYPLTDNMRLFLMQAKSVDGFRETVMQVKQLISQAKHNWEEPCSSSSTSTATTNLFSPKAPVEITSLAPKPQTATVSPPQQTQGTPVLWSAPPPSSWSSSLCAPQSPATAATSFHKNKPMIATVKVVPTSTHYPQGPNMTSGAAMSSLFTTQSPTTTAVSSVSKIAAAAAVKVTPTSTDVARAEKKISSTLQIKPYPTGSPAKDHVPNQVLSPTFDASQEPSKEKSSLLPIHPCGNQSEQSSVHNTRCTTGKTAVGEDPIQKRPFELPGLKGGSSSSFSHGKASPVHEIDGSESSSSSSPPRRLHENVQTPDSKDKNDTMQGVVPMDVEPTITTAYSSFDSCVHKDMQHVHSNDENNTTQRVAPMDVEPTITPDSSTKTENEKLKISTSRSSSTSPSSLSRAPTQSPTMNKGTSSSSSLSITKSYRYVGSHAPTHPVFANVKAILEKGGFYFAPNLYCRPGGNPYENRNAVKHQDYFETEEEFRKHLCSHGVAAKKTKKYIKCWSEKDKSMIHRWVRMAIIQSADLRYSLPHQQDQARVTGSSIEDEEEDDDETTNLTPANALTQLLKIGACKHKTIAYGHVYCYPGVGFKDGVLGWDMFLSEKDFLKRLSRFGIPTGYDADRIKVEKLVELEYFLTQYLSQEDTFTLHDPNQALELAQTMRTNPKEKGRITRSAKKASK